MHLIEAIMSRDRVSKEEAQELIDDMKLDIERGADPEEVLFEMGFEPDYVFDLI